MAETQDKTPPKIVTVAHQKGGIGKTTTVCNLAACFTAVGDGLRVVVVDLDPQGASTLLLDGGDPATVGSYDLVTGTKVSREAVRPSKVRNCLVVPATARLVMSDMDSAMRTLSFADVNERLRTSLRGADVIILDCPSGFGTVSTMAMSIADLIIVPTPPLLFESRALRQTINHVTGLRRDAEDRLAVVLNMCERRSPIQAVLAKGIRREWGSKVVGTTIPRDPAVDEATGAQELVVFEDPKAPAALAFRVLADEMALRLGLIETSSLAPVPAVRAAASETGNPFFDFARPARPAERAASVPPPDAKITTGPGAPEVLSAPADGPKPRPPDLATIYSGNQPASPPTDPLPVRSAAESPAAPPVPASPASESPAPADPPSPAQQWLPAREQEAEATPQEELPPPPTGVLPESPTPRPEPMPEDSDPAMPAPWPQQTPGAESPAPPPAAPVAPRSPEPSDAGPPPNRRRIAILTSLLFISITALALLVLPIEAAHLPWILAGIFVFFIIFFPTLLFLII